MIAGLFGLVTITALGWALYNVFGATMSSLTALASVGWGAYVGADPNNTLGFLLKCLINSACGPVLGQQWVAHYALAPVLVVPPALIATILATRFAHRPKEKKAPGHAHWGTIAELIREGYVKTKTNKSVRGYFGIHKDSKKIIQLPEHIRFSHCLVIGGPGARKSTGYHKQNIIQDMRDGVNIIVFDLKYPDPRGGFFDMVTLAADQYGYDVQLMLPYDRVTHRYSLLAKATTEAGAREVASMILPPGEGGDGSEFYRNNERIILTALILAAARKQDGSFKEIVDTLRQGYRGMASFVRAANDPDVANMIGTVLDGLDTEKQKGTINGLLGKLEIFGDPDLLEFGQLSKDPRENIDLRRFANSKTILYIGIPQQKLGPNGQMFLQLIKRSIDNELGEISRENAGVFPIPISYYLDEFANFGPLPDIGADFATMRSRRLSYHVTVQNMAQGAAVYGHQEWESFYRSNFQSVLIFPRYIRFGDADLFSKFAGNLTTIEQSTSDSKGGIENRTSINTREVSRPLMSTEEMKEWPQAEGVAFLNGVAPVRVILPRLDEKHVRGYKNPYHDDYLRIPDKLNPYEWIRNYFARHTTDRRQQLLHDLLRQAELAKAQQRAELEHAQRVTALARPASPATPTPAAPAPAPAAGSVTATQSAPSPTPRPVSAPTRPAAPQPASTGTAPATPPAGPPSPQQPVRGVRRFNQFINTLIKARTQPSNITLSKRRRLLSLTFELTPEVRAWLEPHHDLLVTRTQFLTIRQNQLALTRAGLAHLAPNYAAYYYKLGGANLSRQQRAALTDPNGPEIQLPLSHTAAKSALRQEIKRLARGRHFAWSTLNGRPTLTVPLEHVDARKLHVYGSYWQQLAYATPKGGAFYIRPKILKSLPPATRAAFPPRPDTPQPKDAPPAPQAPPQSERQAVPTEAQPPEQATPPPPPPTPPATNERAPTQSAPAQEPNPATTPGRDSRAATQQPQAAPAHPPRGQEARENKPQSVRGGAAQPPRGTPPRAPQPAPTEEVTPAGLKPMPEFVRQNAATIVKPGEASTADTAVLLTEAVDRAAVREWISENSERLTGHPNAGPAATSGNALGKYAGEHYLITRNAALKLLAESDIREWPAHLKHGKYRLDGKENDWVLVDPSTPHGEDLVLIANIHTGNVEGEAHHLEALVELPLTEATSLLPTVKWENIQATMRGKLAYVKLFITNPPSQPVTLQAQVL